MGPRVSVLIPCYNMGKYLPEALEGVLAQSYPDYEIIVADDGSEDDTAAVAARYPRVRYVHTPHSGIPATRNLLLSLAQGELIAFLDADDLWTPDKLEKQVGYLDSHPDCQIVFTRVRNFFDGDPGAMTARQEQLLNANTDFCLASACLRRSLFTRYGGYWEGKAYGEDTLWVFRLRASGINMNHCIPEQLYLRRIHDGNISLSHAKVEQKDMLSLIVNAIRQSRKEEKDHAEHR